MLEPIPFAGLMEIDDMNTNELIEALDQRYGNPHAKDHALIQQAIVEMRRLHEEVKALMGQVNAQ